MPNFHGIIFDLDGTLIDTEQYILQPFNHALSSIGMASLTTHQLASVAGLDLKDALIKVGIPQTNLSAATDAYRSFQQGNPQLMSHFPGTIEVLDELRRMEMPVGIVTGRTRWSTDIVIEKQGLKKYVQSIVCNGDGFAPKPSPEPFIECAKQLSVEPKKVLSVGDGAVDIEGARAAGMKTVRALYGYGALAAAKADYSIRSLEEVLALL